MKIKNSSDIKNSSWNVINVLLYPALFLTATPKLIDILSESNFGEWMLLNSYVVLTVQILSFGFTLSITAHIAEALGENNLARLHAYINASARFIALVSLLVLGLALIPLTFYYTDLGVFNTETWLNIFVATLVIVARFPELLGQSIMKGFEQYDRAAKFNMVNRIGTLCMQFMCAVKGYGVLGILIVTLVSNLLITALQLNSVKRQLKDFNLDIFSKYSERTNLYQFGFWSWLQTVIAVAAFQLDRFIVAAFLGTATVAYYSLAATIANHIHLACEALVSGVFPKFSRLRASGQDTLKLFVTSRALSVGTSLLGLTLLYFISPALMSTWLGADKYGKLAPYFNLFLVFELFLVLTIIPKIYMSAIRAFKVGTYLELFYKTAIIIGMAIGFYLFGTGESLIYGQILGLALSIPILYLAVNNFYIKGSPARESLGTVAPSSILAFVVIYSNSISEELFWTAISFGLIWLTFVVDKNFDRKVILS
jgi:O-antigen/teichoic acid export membrane protein